MSVLFLGLGGTIACRLDNRGLAVARLSVADLLDQAGLGHEAEGEDFLNVPSSDLTFDHLNTLRKRIRRAFEEGHEGVVITQGTDTIEEVAYTLHVWERWPGPIVVSGSMRHADLPGFDGPANVRAAHLVASAPQARGMGVLVLMNDTVHGAADVTKAHTQNVATFVSPNWGPVGIIHEDEVTFGRHVGQNLVLPAPSVTAGVNLLRMTLGISERLVEAALESEGVVIEATGGGHVPSRIVPAIRAAVQRGTVVAATSRTGSGPSLRRTYGAAGAEADLQAAGVHMADGSGLKVRIRLALALSMEEQPDLAEVLASWT